MRRDMDLVRQLLLLIEDQGKDANDWIQDVIVDGFTTLQVAHHIWLLKDAGLITALDVSTMDSDSEYWPGSLTWQGHEFLSTVRDKDTWERTLDAAKNGGNDSLAAIFDIAKTIAKKKIERFLDIAG